MGEDPQSDPQAAGGGGGGSDSDTDRMVQEALQEAQASLDALQEEAESADQAVSQGRPAASVDAGAIDLLGDVDLQVSVELGRARMLVEEVLRLSDGSVVELDKLAGDPVDVYVNQRLVARGEVLVLNDNFCIRVSEIVANLEEEGEQIAKAARGGAA